MKTSNYILLLFFVLPLLVKAQKDSLNGIKSKNENNRLNYFDINSVGAGYSYVKIVKPNKGIILGFNAGYKLNPFFYQSKLRNTITGYVGLLDVHGGIIFINDTKWDKVIELKLALPLSTGLIPFDSPFYGISFQVYFNLSEKSSIGTNIDVGGVAYNGNSILVIANSLITYRINIGHK